MIKETLIKHLNNPALVSALKEKHLIDTHEKRLRDIIDLLYAVNLDESAIDAVKFKHKEYQKISKGYDQMIETVWELQWQAQEIITKHIDWEYYDLLKLPSDVKL